MSLTIIVGKSGKSKYMYSLIKACENINKHALVFVPKSYKILAENEYINYTKSTGILNANITDINTYICRIIDLYDLQKEKTLLPDLAKKMCIKKCIKENNEIFKIFKNVKDTNGFIETIYNYLSKAELERSFDKYVNNKTNEETLKLFEDNVLNEKVNEIFKIYLKFLDEIKEKFVTSNNEMEMFKLLIEESKMDELFENTEVFFDNYNNFSNAEFDIIKTLLKKNINTTITIDLDLYKASNMETNIYNISCETYNKLIKIAKELNISINIVDVEKNNDCVCPNTAKVTNLGSLKENIFCISNYQKKEKNANDDTVKLVVCDNPYEEIKYIAKQIKIKVKQNSNVRYKDFAIYTNSVDDYINIIESVFRKYNIPVYIDKKTDIINSNIYRYIKSLLLLIVNPLYKSTEDIFMYLKSGLLDVPFENIYLLENYVKEFGIFAYNFNKDFTKNNIEDSRDFVYDLDKLNNIRKKIIEEISNFKLNILNSKKLNQQIDTKEIVNCIIEHLNSNRITEKYATILEDIRKIDEEEYSKKIQTLKEIYNVFDMISLAYEEITIQEFIELLDYGISSTKVSTIPFMLDQVEVRDINKQAGLSTNFVYMIGAYDGLIPKNIEQDLIFSDSDIENLESKDIKLKEKSTYIADKELFNIYKTIKKANKRICITFPSSKVNGESLRPSYIINDIKEMLNINLEGNVTNIKEGISAKSDDYLSKEVCFDNFIKQVPNYTKLSTSERSNFLVEYNYFKSNEYKKYLDYIRTDNNLSNKTLDSIYNDTIKLSVSKLERFERCPFAYFNEYNLKLLKNKEYEITKLDLGTFMHLVLEKFTQFMIERNIDFKNALSDEESIIKINKKIDEIIDNIFETKYFNYKDSNKNIFLKAKIKNNMKRVITSILDSFKYSDFSPLGYEIEFEEGGLYAPIKIDLDGKTMYLIGKIDRVDTAKINDKIYVRIIDYKSSEKTLTMDMIKNNIALQLMTYMSAIIENKEKISKDYKVIPAAINYFNITNKIINFNEYTSQDKIKEKIKKSLKLKGIYLSNIEILKSMDYNFEDSKESYIDVTKRNISNKNKVLTEDEFKQECLDIKKNLKEIGKDIINGNVRIKPNKKIKDVCKYCDYRSICRKDIKN